MAECGTSEHSACRCGCGAGAHTHTACKHYWLADYILGSRSIAHDAVDGSVISLDMKLLPCRYYYYMQQHLFAAHRCLNWRRTPVRYIRFITLPTLPHARSLLADDGCKARQQAGYTHLLLCKLATPPPTKRRQPAGCADAHDGSIWVMHQISDLDLGDTTTCCLWACSLWVVPVALQPAPLANLPLLLY